MKIRLIFLTLIAGILLLVSCSAPETETTINTSTPQPNELSAEFTSTSQPTKDLSPTPEPTPTTLPSETPPAVEPEAGAGRIWDKDSAEMVYVPSGIFLMGSDDDNDQADNDEYPQHEVYLDGFWIDRYEVTNQQYGLCVKEGICDPPSEDGSFTRDMYFKHPEFLNYPVVWVNWHDANRYCEWAGKQLPTEAQWEKAARGTDAREYPWGDESPDETRANYGSNVGDTTETGYYSPQGDSPYGCADMSGNVLEWVKDWYSGDYFPLLDQIENPQGASSSPIQARVARGGSWIYPARRSRAALRVDRLPELQEGNIGFRCVFSY
jgi:serine/threonine-protein kinase